MDEIQDTASGMVHAFERPLEQLLARSTEPEAILQLVLLAVAVPLALLLGRLIEPLLEARLRRVRDRPRLLRFLAVVLRRTKFILLAVLLWIAYAAALRIGGSEAVLLLRLAATLVSAWVVISIASRVVRNRTAARTVALIGWTLLALELLGVLDPLSMILDARAVSLGSTRISLLSLAKGVIILVVMLWLSKLLAEGIQRRVDRTTDLTPSVQVLVGKLVRIAFVAMAIFASLAAVGIDVTALTVFSGALGLGIGIGLQTIVSNFISGLIILVDKSIKPGDVIEMGDMVGWVRSLRARFVSIVARDGREILVPNDHFVKERVVNWYYTDTRARLDVTFGVSYTSDPHLVRVIAREAAAKVERVMQDPAPVCHITGFGESSIDFVLRFWIPDAQNGLTNVRGDVFLALWDALKENGIEIPFPHRQLVVPAGARIVGVEPG
ncbi:mechanosensitive ion channel family protein [Amorphus sp. MBR-141]